MLTLKLCNTVTEAVHIVECRLVRVERNGTCKKVRANTVPDGPKDFEVGAGKEWNVAYVENAAGSTTQTIR